MVGEGVGDGLLGTGVGTGVGVGVVKANGKVAVPTMSATLTVVCTHAPSGPPPYELSGMPE